MTVITSGPFKGLLRNHYKVIEADPAWIWKSYSSKGDKRSPNAHYKTMTIPEICELPVAELAAPDCALFLWSTWPTMPAPWKVMEAWGFNYSGLAWEWFKWNPTTGKAHFGQGLGGTRKNLEPCILARRGKPPLRNRAQRDWLIDEVTGQEIISLDHSILTARHTGRHSQKPVESKERIELMFDGPYLELFSRLDRDGWDSWGHEAGKFNPPKRHAEIDDLIGGPTRFSEVAELL